MANRSLFATKSRNAVPSTQGYRNNAGGKAYKLEDSHALCQYVVTGTFNQTFYASAGEQLDKVVELCGAVSNEMLAKAAIYGHRQGRMKDVPAYILATLAARSKTDDDARAWLTYSFGLVITNIKMLCNFVQIVRSGKTGRRSFGTAIKRLIQNWLISRESERFFASTIGHANPSVADIIKMVRPRPETPTQDAMFAYLLGKDYDVRNLPQNAKDFEAFKQNNTRKLPNLPFRALTNCDLSSANWREIALDMPWNTLRMNINMLNRNGVFEDKKLTDELARRLGDAEAVRKCNAFPYQLLTTYQAVRNTAPNVIVNALQDALEVATENVPTLDTDVAICIDLSGSMGSPVTGYREGSTTVTTCVDVAALVGASLLRTNPNGTVIAWASSVGEVKLNSRDSVMTNAQALKSANVGHGTNSALALEYLNRTGWKGDAVVYVSDNESWIGGGYYGQGTGMAQEWKKYVKRNPRAKLVCLDIQPGQDCQVEDGGNIMNIGGFSDSVWKPIAEFVHRGNVNFTDLVREYDV